MKALKTKSLYADSMGHEASVCLAARTWDPDKIKALRVQLGLTQEEFAKRYEDFSLAQIQSWERGARNPSRFAQKLLDSIQAAQIKIQQAYEQSLSARSSSLTD